MGGTSSVGAAAVNLGTAAHVVSTNEQFEFVPKTVQSRIGEIVQWNNTSSVAHTVTFDAYPAITDPLIAPNAFWEIRFTVAGTYPYRCVIHPNMTGTIIVSP